MISWKYLPSGSNPVEDKMISGSLVWTSIGRPTIVLSESGSSGYAEVEMPATEIFGTDGGYLWIGLTSQSFGQFWGVKSIGEGGYTGPFFESGSRVIVDAQWLKARGDWPSPVWEIKVGDPSELRPNPSWIDIN
jgi:hypothetical protein